MTKPMPKNIESPYKFDELFFSVTDGKGLIKYGNDVFIRVSRYSENEIIHKPHNIIRHPDMPKSVFKLFWSRLLAGKPIAAYVKNMAQDGSYYWVFAFAFPVENDYLSIRFKPSSKLFGAIQTAYAQVLEEEKLNGMLAGGVLLEKLIRTAGFTDYETFMVAAAIEELNCRDQQAQPQLTSVTENSPRTLDPVSVMTQSAVLGLNTAFSKIGEFKSAGEIFLQNTTSMQDGFHTLNIVSLNMIVAAAKQGAKTVTLGVVSREFSRISAQIETQLKQFSEFMVQLSEVIQTCSLRLAILKTEMLMVDFFVKEMTEKMKSSKDAAKDMTVNRKNFTGLFQESASGFIHDIELLTKNLKMVFSQLNEIRDFIGALEVVRQIGAIEAARSGDAQQEFQHYLDEMDQFNLMLRKSMVEIHREGESLIENLNVTHLTVGNLSTSVNDIFHLALKDSIIEISAA